MVMTTRVLVLPPLALRALSTTMEWSSSEAGLRLNKAGSLASRAKVAIIIARLR
jgi:hypothetical protein